MGGLYHGFERCEFTGDEQPIFRLGVRAVFSIESRMDYVWAADTRDWHGGDATWLHCHQYGGSLEVVGGGQIRNWEVVVRWGFELPKFGKLKS